MNAPPRLSFLHYEVFSTKFTATERIVMIIKTLQDAGLMPGLDLVNIESGEVQDFISTLNAAYQSIDALGCAKATTH